jgi:hypothetical protein
VTITGSDGVGESGLHPTSAYSFNGGTTRQSSNTGAYTTNQTNLQVAIRDAVGNRATASITFNNIDNVAPIVTLSGDNPQYLEVKTAYRELGATANDAIEGTVAVTINSGNVNMNQTGSYSVYYTAVDSAGNT